MCWRGGCVDAWRGGCVNGSQCGFVRREETVDIVMF